MRAVCRARVTEIFPTYSPSARHARGAAAGQHAHALARLEGLVGALRDSDQTAVVEFDRDLQARLAGDALLDRAARNAAGDGADHGADDGTAAAAQIATGDAADDAPGNAADRRLGAFDLHLTHAFDHAHAHRHFAPRLIAAVGRAGQAACAAGQCNEGGGEKGEAERFHGDSLFTRIFETALALLCARS